MSLAEELRAAISFKDNETDHRVACVVLTNLPAILAALEAQEEPRKGERRLLPHYGRRVRAQRRKVAGTKEQRGKTAPDVALTKLSGDEKGESDRASPLTSSTLPDRIDALLSGVPTGFFLLSSQNWADDACALLREAAKELR